jgi:hypothetical protein
VAWVPDLLDDVASDLSVFHRVDDWTRLSSERFFVLARRLVHYPGAVRFELTRLAERTAPPVSTPDRDEVAQVTSLDDARRLRDELRRRRYPAEQWGDMRTVSVHQANAEASQALAGHDG